MAETTANQNVSGSDGQQQSVDTGSGNNNAAGKTYSEEQFKLLIKERDDAKKKLRDIEKAQEDAKTALETAKAQASGDYTKLVEDMQKKEKALKKQAGISVLTSLAAQYQLIDIDDVTQVNIEVELDDSFEVKNMDAIKKAFEDFKTKKPYKFKTSDGTQVPQTDNQPFNQPIQGKAIKIEDIGKMTKEDFIKNKTAIEALLKKK